MQYKQKDKNAQNNESSEQWPFQAFFITFLSTIKTPKNCPFCKNFLCNILLHMQHVFGPSYTLYIEIQCPLFANKTPSFCPPEKNGISRQGKRLRFNFNSTRYNYPQRLVSAFCIFIRLRLFMFQAQNRRLYNEKVRIFINRPCFCIIIQRIFMYNVYTAKSVLLYQIDSIVSLGKLRLVMTNLVQGLC